MSHTKLTDGTGGWYDPEHAVLTIEEEKYFDGNNNVSMCAGQYGHETLHLTKSGRWVKSYWSQMMGTQDQHTLMTDEDVADWLIANEITDYDNISQAIVDIIDGREI